LPQITSSNLKCHTGPRLAASGFSILAMHERTPSPTPLAWLMEGRRVNAEASLRTPESISQPYQEVDGDSSPRKRKDRETSTEPDINGKKPRTLNTPADVEGGHTSSASNSGMRLGSRFAANPSGGMVEGEGQNLDTAIDLTASGITSPKESLTSPTTPPEPPTATFPRRPQACQCSMCGDSESEVDEEFDNRVINPGMRPHQHDAQRTLRCSPMLTSRRELNHYVQRYPYQPRYRQMSSAPDYLPPRPSSFPIWRPVSPCVLWRPALRATWDGQDHARPGSGQGGWRKDDFHHHG